MPTRAQIEELYNNCTMTSTYVDGVYGYLYTSMKKGYTNKSIFIPRENIWTSEVYNNTATSYYAHYYYPGSNISYANRYYGYYIRPVYKGNTQLSDGQRINLTTKGRKRNADESLTLSGTLNGLTSGMTVSQVGFVISDAETVGVSTPADKTLTATLGADGTFAASLEAGFTDRYPEDGRVYMRAYAIINGETYYADAKSWYISPRDTTIATILMPASVEVVKDLSQYSQITINHLYDDGGIEQYSSNCDGYLRLIAADGCTWKITGTVETESESYDWLTIYDGETNSSGFVGGKEKIAGRPQFSIDLQSTSNVILIRFRKDSSVTYAGIDLKLVAE